MANLRDKLSVLILVFFGASYPRNSYTVFAQSGEQAEIATLHLVALVPLEETAGLSPPDRGKELIAAAEMAVDMINMRDDILTGYRLELVPANAELCNESLVAEAPGNFVKHVTSGELNIVGVVGLLCSTVTQAVSSLAGRPEIDLLQISAGATSPVFSSEEEYPRLYRMMSSSAVYNDAVLEMMATFDWKRISVIRDTKLIQHTTTADDFMTKVESRAEGEVVFLGDVTPTFPTSPVQSLLPERARIIYASVTASEARELLCESYQNNLRWPQFVWLFQDLSLEDLKDSTGNCSNETMLEAVEGVFLLQYRIQTNLNTTLVSGQTYQEYLMELQHCMGGAQMNQFADALHDSIWAFALALNNVTYEELRSYRPEVDNSNTTALVEQYLEVIHFSGALGDISFSEREVVNDVDIFHVVNGAVVCIGNYNPLSQNLTIKSQPEIIPKDDFKEETVLLHRAFMIVTYIVVWALMVFTTAILILFIYYWNKPSIKASSPILSSVIFAGCYVLYLGCLIAGANDISASIVGPMCLAQVWFNTTGLQLIYSALFMRLLRVYRIFFHIFSKPGKIWSDYALVALSFIPVLVTILLMTIWTVVDPIVTGYTTPVFDMTSDPPQYTRDVFCETKRNKVIVWLSVVLYGVNGATILGVVVLATVTRKVHLNTFRDTKQVNVFVFSTAACLCIWLPYTVVFTNVLMNPEASYVFNLLPYLVVPFLCVVFLFIPKICSSRHEKRRSQRKSTRASRALFTAMHEQKSKLSFDSGHPQFQRKDTAIAQEPSCAHEPSCHQSQSL